MAVWTCGGGAASLYLHTRSYILRQGVTSWSVFFLLKAKGVADVGQAAFRVSGLELGGLLGSLIAGKWYAMREFADTGI